MSYAAHRRDFAPYIEAADAGAPDTERKGLFTRLLHGFMESRQRRADREIARYFQTHGFTDNAEREIMERLIHGRS
jgi:hypothetical protein